MTWIQWWIFYSLENQGGAHYRGGSAARTGATFAVRLTFTNVNTPPLKNRPGTV